MGQGQTRDIFIAVGTAVASRLPHRSVLEELPHAASASEAFRPGPFAFSVERHMAQVELGGSTSEAPFALKLLFMICGLSCHASRCSPWLTSSDGLEQVMETGLMKIARQFQGR
jgi:hypothetical protein